MSAAGPGATAGRCASCWCGRASRCGGSPSCTSTTRRARRARVRVIETCARLLERERPDEVEAAGPVRRGDAAGRARPARRGASCSRAGRAAAASRCVQGGASWTSRLNTAKTVLRRAQGRAAAPPAGAAARPARAVLFLSHAAFWKERATPETARPGRYEHYFDRLIPELDARARLAAAVLAVGPRAPFRRRGRAGRRCAIGCACGAGRGPVPARQPLHDAAACCATSGRARAPAARAVARAARRARRASRRSRTAASPFADLAEGDLAGTLLLQLPWAIRSLRGDARGARRSSGPPRRCLYAESSGWGRAALARLPRRRGVPTVAIQHGIVYPKYFSYRHDPDEADCPRPDRTAVFGEAARRLLVDARRLRAREPRHSPAARASTSCCARRAPWDREALRAASWACRTASAWSWWPAASAPSATRTTRSAARSPALVARGRRPGGRPRDRQAAPGGAARTPTRAVLRERERAASRSLAAARTCIAPPARGRRAGHGGVALRRGGAGARPARWWC